MCGTAILCVGALLQAGSTHPAPFLMMLAGRAICGTGVAIVSTSVPLYQRFVGFMILCDPKDGLLT